VAGRQAEQNPIDLGALLPSSAASGVSLDVALSPRQSITYSVVVTVPGQYIFQEQASGDPPSAQITGPGLDRPLAPSGTNDTLLAPGVYSIQLENATNTPDQDHLFVRLSSDQTELVLANGVGQGPALSLRLITFSEVTSTSATVTVTPPALGPSPMAHPGASASGTTDSIAGSKDGPIHVDSQSLRGFPITDTLAATTSYSGLGPGLIGRPAVAVYGIETAPQEAAEITGSQSYQGAVSGQSLKAFPTGPARFFWESAGPTDGDLALGVTRSPAQATMISLDLHSAIEATLGLQRWAFQHGGYLLNWGGSRSEGQATSEAISVRFASLIPWHASRRPDLERQPGKELREEEADRANAWARLLSPQVVVLSVAAIAQMCWFYMRWRQSRRHSEQERIAPIPTQSMRWHRLNVFR
jgi:hypothetical protein